jgi:hypothetical protein
VLLCERTFLQVKDLARELGCVTEAGLKPEMMETSSLWSKWLERLRGCVILRERMKPALF